ncbi:GDSL-type esterase/lipase family protein [Nocardia arizonensis]|uniref:GDSL-type esterase/lipase family protein n=1 Tax=Nocardia arizonensis TaxID=1141647 RepID=UPI0006CFF759|nr:GDSL-type esterase/lipase family protein [Nocardia arizonensis]
MPVKLVVIGDSFVEGRGDPAPGGGYRGWIPAFARLLGIGDDECRNHGEHLATTATVRDRQLVAVRTVRPQVAGMIAGFNDIVGEYRPAEFRDNLREIFATMSRAASVAFTATYPDVTDRLAMTAAARADIRGRTTDANSVLRRTAAEFGMVCVDAARAPLSEVWRDGALWSDDGIHPNRLGYRLFAEQLADAVAEDLGVALPANATYSAVTG